MRQNYRLPLEFFFFLSIYFIFVESVLLKNQNRLKKTQNKCNKNCDNPVYIQSRLGKYLDVAPDFEAEEGASKIYSKVVLSTNYHTWCIHEEGIIQSNENNFVLVYLGTVRCGALPGTCGWQAQILAFSKDRFTSQQNWEIKVENTGFTSLKETLTTRNGLTDRQGWLIVSGEEVSLKITDENEVKGQWIVSTAPSC